MDDEPRSLATFGVAGRCLGVGQTAVWSQDAIELPQMDPLHEALRAAPRGWTGNDLQRALQAASAQTGVRGG